jgi:hypothetical protein
MKRKTAVNMTRLSSSETTIPASVSSGPPRPPATPCHQEVRPLLAGDRVDGVEGLLSRHRHADPRQQRADQADREREAAALQRARRELEQGDLLERGVEHVLLVVGAEDEAEQRREQQQQREQREEAVVGHQRGLVAGAVVGELLDHGERDRERGVALLETVEPRDDVGDDAHLPLCRPLPAAAAARP